MYLCVCLHGTLTCYSVNNNHLFPGTLWWMVTCFFSPPTNSQMTSDRVSHTMRFLPTRFQMELKILLFMKTRWRCSKRQKRRPDSGLPEAVSIIMKREALQSHVIFISSNFHIQLSFQSNHFSLSTDPATSAPEPVGSAEETRGTRILYYEGSIFNPFSETKQTGLMLMLMYFGTQTGLWDFL